MSAESVRETGAMSEPIYPSIRNAIFSALMDHYGGDDFDQEDQEFATELTEKILEALRHVEGNPLHIDGDVT